MLVAITRTDGGVSVMNMPGGGDSAAILAEIAAAGISAASWRIVTPANLPVDRTDRDSWQDDGVTIAVNAIRKAALLDAKREKYIDQLQSDALRALATALFQTINSVRALQSQPPLTAAQYRTYLKGLL